MLFFPMGILGKFFVHVSYFSEVPDVAKYSAQFETAAFWFLVFGVGGGLLWLLSPHRFRVVGWAVLMMWSGFAFQIVFAQLQG